MRFLISYGPIALTLAVFMLYFIPVDGTNTGSNRKIITRVVSLSPSLSRQMMDLGSAGLLIGMTAQDEFARDKSMIIGTIVQPNLEKIMRLKPDLVILSEEDNPVQRMEPLINTGIDMYVFQRNKSADDIFANYTRLAELLNRKAKSKQKISHYKNELAKIGALRGKKSIAFLISIQPLITVSNKSYIGSIMNKAGGNNAFGSLKAPYPLISIEHLAKSNPDIILIMQTGGVDLLSKLLKDFPWMKTVKNKLILPFPVDNIAYYTPRDYVLSVKHIARILRKAESLTSEHSY